MSDILVKAIRVRVQSLANSLVVRNPDHFFMHPVARLFRRWAASRVEQGSFQ
jgi:hypothetical protein